MSLFAPLRRSLVALLAGVALVVAPSTGALLFPTLADAAVINGAITNVEIVETTQAQYQNVRINLDWRVPDGTQAGDTFTLTLGPPALWDSIVTNTFNLVDPATGEVVATATIRGLTVTFTMTAYAESHINVRGTAYLTAKIARDADLGNNTATLTTDGPDFTDTINVTGGQPIGENQKQGGIEPDGPDPDNYLDGMAWRIDTEYATSNQTVRIVDTPVAPLTIDCSSIEVRRGTQAAGNPIVTGVVTSCTPTRLVVDVPVTTGQKVTVFGLSPFPAGFQDGDQFTNRMTVTINGATATDSTTVTVPEGGGTGTGDQFVEVGNYVWNDADHDGVQDAGETGIGGVGLTISRTDGQPVRDYLGNAYDTTTTSAANGSYLFTNLATLPAGVHYVVSVGAPPAGFYPTLTGQGTTATDSSTGSAESTDLTTLGANDFTLDFGFWNPEPAITITKSDINGNAGDTEATAPNLGYTPASTRLTFTVTNSGNEPIRGVTITDDVIAGGEVTGLTCTFPGGSTGTTWAGPFAVGASFGCTANLSGVSDATVHHDVATATGTGTTSGETVDDTNDYYATADPEPVVSVGDYVWHDLDKDGVQDANEPGLVNVTVTLTGPTGTVIGTQTTDANGAYLFAGLDALPAGQRYTVTVTTPAGYAPTIAGVGSDATDSSTGSAESNDLTADGDADLTLDFGFIQPEVSVGDYVWLDTDHDGIQDAGENGLAGVRLTITRSDGQPARNADGSVPAVQTTGTDGSYLFEGLAALPAGVHYVVTVDPTSVPAGLLPTITGAGTAATDSSAGSAESGNLTTDGDTDTTLDFGFWAPAPALDVEKTDTNGNDADTAGTAVNLGNAPGSTGVEITVTNIGNEPLTNFDVADVVVSNGTVTALTCTWPDGTTGTTWAGVLAPGASVDCTATVTGVAVSATPHQDTVTVTAEGAASGTGVTDSDDFFATVTANPGIDIEKVDAAGNDADTQAGAADLGNAPGSTVVTYTVTNNGDEPVTDVVVTDIVKANGDLTGLSCTFPDGTTGAVFNGTLAPGASFTCTGNLANVGPGAAHQNTGTVSAVGTISGTTVTDSDDYWATVTAVPGIDVEKVDAAGNDGDDTPVNVGAAPGTTTITFQIANTGTEPLLDVRLTDVVVSNGDISEISCTWPGGSTGTTFAGPFAVGATATCTATLTGVAAGEEHVDIATVTGTGQFTGTTATDDDEYHAVSTGTPDIDIEKADAAGNDADTAATASGLGTAPGSTSINYVITNTGTEPLTGVNVTDVVHANGDIANLTCTWPDGTTGVLYSGRFGVGEQVNCTATLTGVAPGAAHHNTGTVTATGVATGTTVTDSDDYFATVTATPAISITKDDFNGNAADLEANAVNLGDAPGSAEIVYTVMNTGDEPLTGIAVSDIASGSGTITDFECVFPDGTTGTLGDTWAGQLAVGESFQCTATLSGVAPGNVHSNTGTVAATGVYSGTAVTDSNNYWAYVNDTAPAIDIEKVDAAGNDADTQGDAADLGDAPATTTLTYTITNRGNETLRDMVVTDLVASNGDIADMTCEFPDGSTGTTWAGPFNVGDTITCTATLMSVGSGAAHQNTGTVTATGYWSGTPVTDSDDYWATADEPIVYTPDIDIEKTDVDGNDADTQATAADLGDAPASTVINYVITNTGDEPLTGIAVSDELLANGEMTWLTCVWPDGTIAQVPADAPLSLTWNGTLEVGGTFTCTANLVNVAAATAHHDVASVTATGTLSGGAATDSDAYWATADTPVIVTNPAIDIEKVDAAGNDADTQGSAVDLGDAPAGTQLTFTVTNTGDEALRDVVVSDKVIAGGKVTNLVCTFPNGATGTTWAGLFQPGVSFGCTATLASVPDDVIHQDVATVTGVGVVNGSTVTDSDAYWATADTPVIVTNPAIDIEKVDAAGNDADTQGSAVDLGDAPAGTQLTFTVTNTGDEALRDVVVSDKVIAGGKVTNLVCTFPDGTKGATWAGPFLPGDTFTCTATLTGVSDDVAHHDVATVTATGNVNGETVTDSDAYWATADTPVIVTNPAIDIEKVDAAGNDADTQGSAVDLGDAPAGTQLAFTVTNVGDEALGGITVSDKVIAGGEVTNLVCTFPDETKGVTWAGPFDVGVSFGCTATLTGVSDDVAHHDVATVTATGNVNGETVTDSDAYWATADTPVIVTNPAIDIEKVDAAGNDADTDDDAVSLGVAPGAARIAFTVTNTGDEPLRNIEVTDTVIAGGKVTNLVCTFPDNSQGTTWAGPFQVGVSFGCTADLTGVLPGGPHHDVATATGIGVVNGGIVTDTDAYWATAVNPPADPVPGIGITKGDTAGNAADTTDSAVDLYATNGATGLDIEITNTGEEALMNVTVTDAVVEGGTVTGLTCDWSAYGGPTSGATFDGPFPSGGTVSCTASLSGIGASEDHHDIATVTGAGQVTGQVVSDDNPYYALNSTEDGGGDGGFDTEDGGGGGGINTGLPGNGIVAELSYLSMAMIAAGAIGLLIIARRRRVARES